MSLKRLPALLAGLFFLVAFCDASHARTPRAAREQAAQKAAAKAQQAAKKKPVARKRAVTLPLEVSAASITAAMPAANAGLTAANEMNGWLDAIEASGQVAGLAVAVVQGDQVLLQRGVGYADAATRAPVTPSTVFRLASLSKSFAATLAGQLVDAGYLSWDTRIAGVLPTFSLKDLSLIHI